MAIRIVQPGTARERGEGVRIGTVRRPPRGVPRTDFATGDWYDVWFPNLAPSADLVAQAQRAATEREWAAFVGKYRKEMAVPEHSRTLDVLAALSHGVDFSLGCYCADDHRTVAGDPQARMGAREDRDVGAGRARRLPCQNARVPPTRPGIRR